MSNRFAMALQLEVVTLKESPTTNDQHSAVMASYSAGLPRHMCDVPSCMHYKTLAWFRHPARQLHELTDRRKGPYRIYCEGHRAMFIRRLQAQDAADASLNTKKGKRK